MKNYLVVYWSEKTNSNHHLIVEAYTAEEALSIIKIPQSGQYDILTVAWMP